MTDVALIEKPRPGWRTVESDLRQLTVVTWAVEPARLRSHVPLDFALEMVGGRALISAVTFHNTNFRPHWAPMGLALGQTNYRVYVQRDGQRGVFFVGTAIDTAFVWVPRYIWKMPWSRARYRFSPGVVEASGSWSMALSYAVGDPADALPGFASLNEGLSVLTQPSIGYYRGSNGRIGRYTIWHDPYRAHTATISDARFSLLDELGIVPFSEQRDVHSALYEACSRYHIHLPPRWITDTPR